MSQNGKTDARQNAQIAAGSKLAMAYKTDAGKQIIASVTARIELALADYLNPDLDDETIRQKRQRVLGLIEHLESDHALIKTAIGFATKQAVRLAAEQEGTDDE
jgi:hypothetical protein